MEGGSPGALFVLGQTPDGPRENRFYLNYEILNLKARRYSDSRNLRSAFRRAGRDKRTRGREDLGMFFIVLRNVCDKSSVSFSRFPRSI